MQHFFSSWVMHTLLLNICIPPSSCSPVRLALKTNCSKLLSCKTCYFLCAGMMQRGAISQSFGLLFFRLRGGWRCVFFIYRIAFLTGVCIFQRNYLLYMNTGLFMLSFQGKSCRWNKLPFNLSFTVVSCKWRNGSLCEPSKLWNKCTISCMKVLKPISTHFRIIMYFKSICWNINTIM